MDKQTQIQRSGRLLEGFNSDHHLLQEKRRSVFNLLLQAAIDSNSTVLPLRVEEILYQAELPVRTNPRAETQEVNPFNWIGTARVEQAGFLQFIHHDSELSRKIELIICDPDQEEYTKTVDELTYSFFEYISKKSAFHGPKKTCPIAHIPNIFHAYFSAFIADYLHMKQTLFKNNIIEPSETLTKRIDTAETAINMLRE